MPLSPYCSLVFLANAHAFTFFSTSLLFSYMLWRKVWFLKQCNTRRHSMKSACEGLNFACAFDEVRVRISLFTKISRAHEIFSCAQNTRIATSFSLCSVPWRVPRPAFGFSTFLLRFFNPLTLKHLTL